jgi:hypothetical protein
LRLVDILMVVGEFGSASPELVAWELWTPEEFVARLWDIAIAQRLLQATGPDELGEMMYRLTPEGRARLGPEGSDLAVT